MTTTARPQADADAAFRRAICEQPGDDLPRLAYADYLEESGQEARAHFIRCQCEYARCKALVERWVKTPSNQPGGTEADGGPAGEATAMMWPLKRRARKLLLANWQSWVPRFDDRNTFEVILSKKWKFSGTPAVRFRRGFVDEVRAPLAALVGGECERCQNGRLVERHNWTDYAGSGWHELHSDCPHCHGTGHTTGIAERLIGVEPCVFIASDKEPYEAYFSPGRFAWRSPGSGFDSGFEHELPQEIFDLLTDCDSPAPTVKWYESKASTLTALSQAVAAVGRASRGGGVKEREVATV